MNLNRKMVHYNVTRDIGIVKECNVYYLDVETLLRILQQRKMTGHAYSNLPSRFDGLFLLCRVTVDFKEGQLMSCVIIDQNDQLIYQAFEAMQKIQRLTLQWTLQETFPQAPTHQVPADHINYHQSAGSTNPGPTHPNANQPNFNQSGSHYSGFNQAGPNQPGFNQSGSNYSGFNYASPNLVGPNYAASSYIQNQPGGYSYPSPVDLQKMRGLVPRRQRQLTLTQMQEWPRNTKNIYTLINGINTVEQMGNLLSLSISDVYAVLLELQRIQLIIF